MRAQLVQRLACLVLLLLDFFFVSGFTLPAGQLPPTCILRAVSLGLSVRSIRIAMSSFLKSIYASKDVFTFFSFFLLISSVLSMELFAGVNPGSEAPVTPLLSRMLPSLLLCPSEPVPPAHAPLLFIAHCWEYNMLHHFVQLVLPHASISLFGCCSFDTAYLMLPSLPLLGPWLRQLAELLGADLCVPCQRGQLHGCGVSCYCMRAAGAGGG